MLKLSTKGRYGLRAMIELAKEYGQSPLQLSDIARRQGFSPKYLHALLTSLKGAGLVRSLRGAKGGYLLYREPNDIAVSEIFRALEGESAIVDCLDDETVCNRVQSCVARGLWQKLNNAISDVLEGTTLAELMAESTTEDSNGKHRK